MLLHAGADITLTDFNGFTALDYAIINGNYECALMLREAGLRPKSIDFYDLKKDIFLNYRVNIPDFLHKLECGEEHNNNIYEKKPSSSLHTNHRKP